MFCKSSLSLFIMALKTTKTSACPPLLPIAAPLFHLKHLFPRLSSSPSSVIYFSVCLVLLHFCGLAFSFSLYSFFKGEQGVQSFDIPVFTETVAKMKASVGGSSGGTHSKLIRDICVSRGSGIKYYNVFGHFLYLFFFIPFPNLSPSCSLSHAPSNSIFSLLSLFPPP